MIASINDSEGEVGVKGRTRRAGAGGEARARAEIDEEVTGQKIGDRDKSAVKERFRSRLGASGEPDKPVEELEGQPELQLFMFEETDIVMGSIALF